LRQPTQITYLCALALAFDGTSYNNCCGVRDFAFTIKSLANNGAPDRHAGHKMTANSTTSNISRCLEFGDKMRNRNRIDYLEITLTKTTKTPRLTILGCGR
jgi:hypothetical protein